MDLSNYRRHSPQPWLAVSRALGATSFVHFELVSYDPTGWGASACICPNVAAIPRCFFPFPASGSLTNSENWLSL
jgi:hypothetical protein